jgi:hypothetical protein
MKKQANGGYYTVTNEILEETYKWLIRHQDREAEAFLSLADML